MATENSSLIDIVFNPDPKRMVEEFGDDDVKMLVSDLKNYAQAKLGILPEQATPKQTPKAHSHRPLDFLLHPEA